MKVDLDDVVSFLNGLSAAAYDRDGENSAWGWAYSLASTRLASAQWQGELKEAR